MRHPSDVTKFVLLPPTSVCCHQNFPDVTGICQLSLSFVCIVVIVISIVSIVVSITLNYSVAYPVKNGD